MSLPITRNENYVSASLPKVSALTLNQLQDLWGNLCKGASTGYGSNFLALQSLLLDGDGGGFDTIPGSGATRARIYVPDEPTVRTLFYQAKIGTGIYLRRYILDNGGVEETVNAKWVPGSTHWEPDDGSHVASSDRIVGTSTVATTYKLKKDAGTSSWADASWDEVYRVDRSGGVYAADFVASSSLQLVGADGYPISKRFAASLQTTDNTSTTIFAFTTPTNSVSRVTLRVNGIRSDHAVGGSYLHSYPIIHNAGTAGAVGGGGGPVIADAEDDVAWGGIIAAGAIGAVAYFDVQGKAATTIKWTADIEVSTVML